MEFSYTVTPSITQDPITGEEVVHVMDADVRSSQAKEFTNIQNVREQAEGQDFWLNEDGEYEFGLEASDKELAILMEDMGGMEVYEAMTFWAQNVLSDSDLDEFDAVMESGELTEMAGMLGQLQQLYQNRSHDVEAWDEAENFVYNEVCSPEVYRAVKEYVANNYQDGDINTFNALVNSNDKDDIADAIRTVIADINGDEYDPDEDDYDDED